MYFDSGSHRDPSGRIVTDGKRVFRAVFEAGRNAFEAALAAGVLDRSIQRAQLLGMCKMDPDEFPVISPSPCHLLEHPRLDFVSYPYEWCFSGLKAAALLHLDLQLDILTDGYTLSDATAYNVQFKGTRPVFIDHLSIVPYTEGEPWVAHRQFTMQFLAPLILWAKKGVAPNPWYRGSLEGIAPEDLLPLLNFRDRLSFTVIAHIVSQARQKTRAINAGQNDLSRKASLPKGQFEAILIGLRDYIGGLAPPGGKTVWADYDKANSYNDEMRTAKHAFVAEMIAEVRPRQVFDLGCNSGDYAQTAIDHGAGNVVGFDFDFGALEHAFNRFSKADVPVLPIWLDAANPSPAQGWAGAERKSMAQRSEADSMIALAFIHHLAIARNIPLEMAVDWLVSLAPTGIIEFPDKNDSMVLRLLSTRKDIFPGYTEQAFISHVEARARIMETRKIEGTSRLLLRYDRT